MEEARREFIPRQMAGEHKLVVRRGTFAFKSILSDVMPAWQIQEIAVAENGFVQYSTVHVVDSRGGRVEAAVPHRCHWSLPLFESTV